MDQNEILRQVLEQAHNIKPQFGMPNSPVPNTGNPMKDMALAMILYTGMMRAGRVPRATFSNQKPPTALGYPANAPGAGLYGSDHLGAGMRAATLTEQNSALPPNIRSTMIPNPGNLNQKTLPRGQNQAVHDMVLEMLNRGQLPPNEVSGGAPPPPSNIIPFPKE